jgi:hypothetical protein
MFSAERIDDNTIEALARAVESADLGVDLLGSTPSRDIRIRTQAIVDLLEAIDLAHLLRRQGIIGRFTGADVEARLEFELASHKVLAAFSQLRSTARNSARVRQLLRLASDDLLQEQARLADVIPVARDLLARSRGADAFSVERFERRLANLMALESANVMTIQQISLSEQLLTALLDRFNDVETLLLPLWQRHALAIAQSVPKSISAHSGEFLKSHVQLIDFLKKVAGP